MYRIEHPLTKHSVPSAQQCPTISSICGKMEISERFAEILIEKNGG